MRKTNNEYRTRGDELVCVLLIGAALAFPFSIHTKYTTTIIICILEEVVNTVYLLPTAYYVD